MDDYIHAQSLKKTNGQNLVLVQVAPGGSVMTDDHGIAGPGRLLAMDKKKAEESIAQGWVTKASRQSVNEDWTDIKVADLPGLNDSEKVNLTEELQDGLEEGAKKKVYEEDKVTVHNPAPKQSGNLWIFDPKDLASQSLDELNALIIEKDSTVTPFETPEEATAFLSQDFNAAQAAGVHVAITSDKNLNSQVATK